MYSIHINYNLNLPFGLSLCKPSSCCRLSAVSAQLKVKTSVQQQEKQQTNATRGKHQSSRQRRLSGVGFATSTTRRRHTIPFPRLNLSTALARRARGSCWLRPPPWLGSVTPRKGRQRLALPPSRLGGAVP